MKRKYTKEELSQFKRVIPVGIIALRHLLVYEEPIGYISGPEGHVADIYKVDDNAILAGGDAFEDWLRAEKTDRERDKWYDKNAEAIMLTIKNDTKKLFISDLLSDYLTTGTERTEARAMATALWDACLDMDMHDYDDSAEKEIDELEEEILKLKEYGFPMLDAAIRQLTGMS